MSAPTASNPGAAAMTTLSRAFLLVALTASSGAWAAGFAVDTQSARATGLATAVVGLIDDPSSIFYNPAGLVRTEGLQIQLGDTLIFPSVTFNPAGEGPEVDSEFTLSPPPHLYVSYKPIERVAVGIGLSTPFGNNSEWPEGWIGSQLTQRASLAVFDMAAVASAELHPRFRLGGSFRVLRGTVDIERQTNFVDSTGGVQLGGAGWGYGWSVGGQVDIVQDVLILGANYRTGSEIGFKGRVHFSDVPSGFSSLLRDQEISSQVELPSFLLTGLAYRPFPWLVLEYDMHYVQWSSFRQLQFVFEDEALTQTIPKRWGDVWSYHLGGEVQLGALALRLGGVWDQSPSPENTLTPELPDSDRVKVTAGAGYRLGMFTGDLGYQLVILVGKDSTAPAFPGRYTGLAHVVGITLGARL